MSGFCGCSILQRKKIETWEYEFRRFDNTVKDMERDGNDACNSRSGSGRAFGGELPRSLKARNASVRSYVAISMLEDCCSEASLILTVSTSSIHSAFTRLYSTRSK